MRRRQLPECRNCKCCVARGRTDALHSRCKLSRMMYFCTHRDIPRTVDIHGRPVNAFIGYGDTTPESPLQLKTCKHWCPLR